MNRLLGRVTTYKLVLMSLALITVTSLVLAALGLLSFSPLTLLLNLVVSLAATVLSSWLIALVFRVKPHLESAVITGFLIFFVLPPSTALWVLALAGAIASASKFLLAWRGRHIFNPAAIAATVVTLTGLTFSGWWVGTLYLTPVVAITAFLILFRTKRLTMGIVFIVVASLGWVVRFGDLAGGLQYAFLQSGMLLLAGFMLSEPLTLPPRRWQQLGFAVLVGVIFALPTIGWLSFTPQLALVIGNLVAFFFGQRRGISLVFTGKKQLTPSTWEFTFTSPRAVRFIPGQYMELTLPHGRADFRGQRRIFSIASAPGSSVTFAMTIAQPGSSFKTALMKLEPGAKLHGTSVGGDFTLPSAGTPVLLVAGGIGITPFASQLTDAAAATRDTVLVYAVRDPAELAYAQVLEDSGARVIVLAPTSAGLPESFEYAGPGRISKEVLAASVPDIATRRAYVSGPPGLVSDVRSMLRSLGAKRIHSDYFSGY